MQRIPQIETDGLVAGEPVREQRMAREELVLRVMGERVADVRGRGREDARIGLRTGRHVENREEVAVRAIEIADPRGEVAASRELLRLHRHGIRRGEHTGYDSAPDSLHDPLRVALEPQGACVAYCRWIGYATGYINVSEADRDSSCHL